MYDDLVGTLMDAGMTPQDARELLGPAYATTHDPGAPIEPVVHTLLTVARDDRQPPGPQVAVPSGVRNSMPDAKDAKVIRVDTEDTYRDFRGGGGVDMQTLDAPENSESVPDMLNQLSAAEAGLSDTVEFQRGSAAQWLMGAGRKKHKRSRVGDIMTRGAASTNSLFNDPAFSTDQTCLYCGVPSGGTSACTDCIIGFFERGPASDIYGKYGGYPTTRHVRVNTLVGGNGNEFYRLQRTDEERATMVGLEEFYRLQHQLEERAILGTDADEFYRLQHQLDESGPPVLGSEEFYRLQHQVDERATMLGVGPDYRLQRTNEESATLLGATGDFYTLNRFIDEARALSATSDAPAEAIPLSFTQPDANEHVATWKQGDDLYASMRVTGWDRQPRILTASMPYAEAVSTVVGYAESARIAPSQTLAVLDPLARSLGASRLVPRLAASAPAVLRVSADKLTPLVMATMPVTNSRVGR
jgi:hypothetical protein